ncbi:MAG: hypothetical protein AB1696_02470 [Planctomycetota bacterium]
MCINSHTRILGLILPILIAAALTACGGEAFPLEERTKFAPGTAFEAEALPGVAGLERRDGGVVLDQKHTTLRVSLPVQTKAGTTYALMCRSKAIEDATFNWIEVAAGGKIVGRVFPCTTTYTNKKVLLPGDGADKLDVTLTLREGPGCVIDSLRLYEASEAYYIKELCPADSRPESEPKPFALPTDAFRDHAIQSALWAEAHGKEGGMNSLRLLVKRTAGWGVDPDTLRMMIGRYIEYLETPELPRQNVGNTSFEMHYPIKRWDEIESDSGFDDAWRLEIVNTLYLMARTSFIDWSAYCLNRYYRDYRERYPEEWPKLNLAGWAYSYPKESMVPEKMDAAAEFNKRHPFLSHNHMTHPARALLFAARYFERYNIPEVPVWNRCAHWAFEPMMHTSKPMEDCSTYQHGAMSLAADFAIAEGRSEFFAKDGALWKFMDLVIMSSNNIGDGPGFGDVSEYPQKRVVPGGVETDVFDAIVKTTPLSMTDEFRKMLGEKRRDDYLGVHVHPLEPLFYDFYMDWRGGIPVHEKERFDKISFRRSFDPNDQYLLLDGLSFGYHGHDDGNSILQFDDENRTWLVERGYQPKYREGIHAARADQHNAVTVARPGVNNGEESPADKIPTFSGLLFRRDGEDFGATSTISRDINGMDWTRHIIWAKERHFVVFDELVAREAGPVVLTCRWRTIGEPRLKDHRFQVTQRPKPDADVKDRRELSLVLVHCDAAAESLTLGIDPPETWAGYPYAGPEVHVLQERFEGDLKPGDRRIFINVFAVTPAGEENALQARRVDETTVEVTYRGRTDAIGPPTGPLHKP